MTETYIEAQKFTIQELSERLNIPKPTLRFWEKELDGIIVPLRSSGGQRRYTETHIPVFEKIKSLRNSGKSISQVRMLFNNGGKMENSLEDNLDMLTQRISELVKTEVIKFLGAK